MRAIDADVLKQHIDKLPALPDGNFAGNHSALKALINMQPTIEPSTNCSEFPNNSDTISREAVADAINKIECTRHTTWYEFYQKVMTTVEKLPPAEHSTNLAEVGTDAISRQAVIYTICDELDKIDHVSQWVYDRLEKALKQLPPAQPAQPEIIRCKDCLMHGLCRFEQGLGLDGYCSQAERSTDG